MLQKYLKYKKLYLLQKGASAKNNSSSGNQSMKQLISFTRLTNSTDAEIANFEEQQSKVIVILEEVLKGSPNQNLINVASACIKKLSDQETQIRIANSYIQKFQGVESINKLSFIILSKIGQPDRAIELFKTLRLKASIEKSSDNKQLHVKKK